MPLLSIKARQHKNSFLHLLILLHANHFILIFFSTHTHTVLAALVHCFLFMSTQWTSWNSQSATIKMISPLKWLILSAWLHPKNVLLYFFVVESTLQRYTSSCIVGTRVIRIGLFNDGLYDPIQLQEKDQYEIIRRFRLIVYHHNLHLWYMVVYIGGMGGIIVSFISVVLL
jgi:signal transduction histidine kinase